MDQFARTKLLIGEENLKKLAKARVLIFGLGGVGGSVVESLARIGIGHFTLVDNDVFSLTNLNRQLLATHETISKEKTLVAKERILSINPEAEVIIKNRFYLPENKTEIAFSSFDYIIDAIDTITAKIDIIREAKKLHIPLISSRGCGNRLDPTKLVITDLSKTKNDPLCKVRRRELKKRGIEHLTVVYSTELPIKPSDEDKQKYIGEELKKRRKDVPGSASFVPPVAGYLIGYKVASDLMKENERKADRK